MAFITDSAVYEVVLVPRVFLSVGVDTRAQITTHVTPELIFRSCTCSILKFECQLRITRGTGETEGFILVQVRHTAGYSGLSSSVIQ